MAKELPYFKFYSAEWLSGDITLESYELQGLFINVCAYYWSKDCELSKINLIKRFRGYDNLIDILIESNIIKVLEGNIVISFLNEQLKSKEVQAVTNRINGLKGGRPKKEITENKPNGLILETESITQTKANDNPNITNIKESKVKESKEDNLKTKNSILDSKKWLESILVKRITTLDFGILKLNEFLDNQELLVGEGNGLNRTENDIKNHFVKWFDLELKKEKDKPKEVIKPVKYHETFNDGK